MSRWRLKSWCLGPVPAAGVSTWRSKPASFWILLFVSLFSVALLGYAAVFSSPGQLFPWTSRFCPTCIVGRSGDVVVDSASAPSIMDHPPSTDPTNISHIVFGIAGSAKTWNRRRAYSQLWWRPGLSRGYVWLDKEPEDMSGGGGDNNMSSSNSSCFPPYRISSDASRFGPRVSAARIARILTESYRLVVAGSDELAMSSTTTTRWLVMGDDDTVFFPDNLVSVLGKYDHRQAYYVGAPSESVEQDVMHSYGMAFGGGGFAVSLPLAAEIAGIFDRCLVRYAGLYGSDQRVQACMSEVGVPLTREPGFHQLDIRGDPFGLLSSHPVSPLVTLHHLDSVKPIFPGLPTQLDAVRKLVDASLLDPARTLQQSICYEARLNWSVSVSWGYSAMVYPRVVPPRELEVPLRTFQTWRSFKDGPFTFNTRPVGDGRRPCDGPLVYFLAKPPRRATGKTTTTEYLSVGDGNAARRKVCGDRSAFLSASKVSSVRVVAPRMDPDDWKKEAPRRRCCDVKRSWWGNRLDVRIRKCRRGQNISPP